jgi:hypothetical protein
MKRHLPWIIPAAVLLSAVLAVSAVLGLRALLRKRPQEQGNEVASTPGAPDRAEARRLSWRLGYDLADGAFDRITPEKGVGLQERLVAVKGLGERLQVELPRLFPRQGAGGLDEVNAHYYLVRRAGPPVAAALASKYGDDCAGLFLLGLRSRLIVEATWMGGRAEACAEAESAARRSGLPEAMWAPLFQDGRRAVPVRRAEREKQAQQLSEQRRALNDQATRHLAGS